MEKEWVTIYKYFDIFEEQKLEEVLKARNIVFKNISRHDSAFDGIFAATIGAGVIQVREDFVEQAKKIVIDFERDNKKLLKESKEETNSYNKFSFVTMVKKLYGGRYFRITTMVVLIILLSLVGFRSGRVQYYKNKPDFKKAEFFLEQGRVSIDQKRYKEALKQLETSVIFNPNAGVSYAGLGYAYFQLNQYELAVKNYEKAIKIEPRDNTHYVGLGSVYVMMGHYFNGIASLRKAIELNPGSEFAYLWLGKAYLNTKNYQLAITNNQEALRIKPNSIPALIGLSAVYYYLNDFDKMLEYAKKAIELDPNDATFGYFNAGLAYLSLKLYKEAIPYFDKTRVLEPKYAQTYYFLGMIYKNLGDENLMKEQYTNLQKLNRSDLADRLMGRPTREPETGFPFRF